MSIGRQLLVRDNEIEARGVSVDDESATKAELLIYFRRDGIILIRFVTFSLRPHAD